MAIEKKKKTQIKRLRCWSGRAYSIQKLRSGLHNPEVPLFGLAWLKKCSFWDLHSQRISCTNNFLLNPKSLRRKTTFEVGPTFEVLKNLEGFYSNKNLEGFNSKKTMDFF